MIRRLNRFSERHPLLSILAGYLLIVVIVLTCIPADPPSVVQAFHERAT